MDHHKAGEVRTQHRRLSNRPAADSQPYSHPDGSDLRTDCRETLVHSNDHPVRIANTAMESPFGAVVGSSAVTLVETSEIGEVKVWKR